MNTEKAFQEMQGAYALLKSCGFTRGNTGGGCSAWIREVQGCEVMITQDATADLAPEYMEDCGIWVQAFDYDKGEQVYFENAHQYADLPVMLLQAFAAISDYKGEGQ